MDLLLDIGNSRIKWALLDAGSLHSADAIGHQADAAAAECMLERIATAPAGVIAANVAGDRFGTLLAGAVRERWGLPVRFAATQPQAGAVHNGYDNFRQLGVDRWLAIIAAVDRFAGAVCVVDAGTAITIDAVAAGGAHLGGYIIPGLDLMRRSLDEETGDLRRLCGDEPQGPADRPAAPGRSTTAAISGGVLAAACCLIDRCVGALGEQDHAPTLVVTGGDADLLLLRLDTAAHHRPQLVLEGLANLLLFAWGRWIVAPDVADPWAIGDASDTRLVLVERTGRTADTASGSGQVSERCFRLGPFSTANAAAAVGDRLSARGLPVDRIREAGRIWVGHWVRLLDLPSIAAARQAVKTLVSGGIGDVYISSQEPTVDISLGVFRGRRGAGDVIRLARDLGFTAEAMDRFRDGIEHWIEVATPADQPPDLADLPLVNTISAIAGSGEAQIVRIEERPCTPVAAVTDAVAVDDPGADDGDGTGADDSLESSARETGSPEPSMLPE